MYKINLTRRTIFLVASIVVLIQTSIVYSQQITRINPSHITMHGISSADYNHGMCVGDSAAILLQSDSIIVSVRIEDFVPPHFVLLQVPVSHDHSFYGVSYYDSLHAIVVGDAGIVLTTSDKGASWLQQAMGLTNKTLRAVTHISGNIFQIVGDGGTILRSNDNGSTWNTISSGTSKALYAEAFGSATTGLIAGEAGTMLKTTDGGQSWNLQPGAGIPYLNFYGVAMLNQDTAIAVGDSALIRYTNDGTIWKTARDSNIISNPSKYPSTARYAPLRTVAYTGLPGTYTNSVTNPQLAAMALGDGDIMHYFYNHLIVGTTPVDTVWVCYTAEKIGDADGGIDEKQARFTCVDVTHNGPYLLFAFAGPYGEISGSIDSTMGRWGYASSTLRVNLDHYFFASFDNAGYGYCTVAGGDVERSTDNGFTWKPVLYGKDVAGVICLDSNTAFVAGWNGELFRTRNGGVKWDSIPSLTQYRLHGFAFTSPDTGFCVGDGGTILRTFDGGTTWNDKSPPYPSFLKVVAFSSTDTGVVVGDNGTLLRTTDGGENWTYNGDHPLANSEASMKYIQAFPDGTYYVGADSAVMKSTDHGSTWEVIYTPPDSVGISFYDSKIGILGEYSTSSMLVPDSMTLKYTTDGGNTWAKEFTVPFYNLHRLLAHWLDDCSFLLYGIEGFIMKVNLCGVNAVTEIVSPASPPMKVYPNPSSQRNVTVEYETEKDGPITIELWDELGKRIAILYSGFEVQGTHERVLILDPNLHGTFFIRISKEGSSQTLRMIKL